MTLSVHKILHSDAAGGVALLLAAGLALVVANMPWPGLQGLLARPGLVFAVNDGLMAVFFFMAGQEIRREMAEGALSNREKAVLPVLAALGGMAVPALVYLAVNRDAPGNFNGWAIPAATDIAFALCVLALAGPRVPAALKVLLLAIAVIDDLGAIVIIALFYGHGLHPLPVLAALAIMAGMMAMNARGVGSVWPYIICAVLLWSAVVQSGLHATLAGVVAALMTPLRFRLEEKIHPFVVFGVLPVFGLINAGVSFAGMGVDSVMRPLTLGIILGLVVGKPLGIFGTLYIAVRSGIAKLPDGITWRQVFGMALLCGIGFTMSLFIGGLAFGAEAQAAIRLGVLCGSAIAAAAGFAVLRCTTANPCGGKGGGVEAGEI